MSGKFLDENKMKNVRFAMSLLSAAINETKPPEPDFEPEWSFIREFTRFHNIDNTVFYSIEKLGSKPEPQLYKEWMNKRNQCYHRWLVQKQEFENICGAFEKKCIEYLPVKGAKIGELYPQPCYRYMSDLDFLIKNDRDKAIDILVDMGYKLKKDGIDLDRPLVKPPFIIAELHDSLFSKNEPFYRYFEDVFLKCEKSGCRYILSGEDSYIYETAHLFKHYKTSGTGIKSIADFYLINKKLLPDYDTDLIRSELEKLGMYEFSKLISGIGEKWFDFGDFEDFSKEELYILSSGTYGTMKHKVENKTRGVSTSRYFFSRLFPPGATMKEFFPLLKKRPIFLPFFYLYRLFKAPFSNRKKISNELELIKSSKKSKG